MKLTNIIVLIISCFFSYNCNNPNDVDSNSLPNKIRIYQDKEKQAFDFLSKNNYLEFIDTAKWYLYNYYCDIKTSYLINSDPFYKKIPKEKQNQYLSSLDLKIIEAYIDTTSKHLYLGAFFFIDDSTILIGSLGNNQGNLPDGIFIDLKRQAFSSYISENMTYIRARSDSKEYETFTPSVRNFIDSNLNLLNPKYLDLLKRMKALK
jgi:hypothetical protein